MELKFSALILLIIIAGTSAFCQNLKLNIKEVKENSLTFDLEDNITLEYGLTRDFELGEVHSLTIENLTDATTYYVRAFADKTGQRQYSGTGVFSTASKSTGEIKVYFNHWCDNSASEIADAVWTEHLEDTIVAYVNSAFTTLDVCNYNTGSLPVVNAINNAESRGVNVRYIAAANTGTNNDELEHLSLTIPFIQRPDDGEVMHNKFIIIDAGTADKATILTGSTNHTYNSCHDDYNNMVIIQDQSLANAYKTEFEEMWGSTGNLPDPANAKFGSDKTDNTPHNFNIGGIPVELYFSPSDGTTAHIESAVLSANTDMQFAILTFINNDLGDAVVQVHDAGVGVKGIIENVYYLGSEYNSLVNAGVDVYSHFTIPYLFHHKYGVVDATNPESDPLVITGSHNWTNSAEEDYDENTLIIHSAVIAGMYHEEFMARYSEINGTGIHNNNNVFCDVELFPDPASDVLNIHSEEFPYDILIVNSLGQTVYSSYKMSEDFVVDLSGYSEGIYSLIYNTDSHQIKKTFIVAR